MESPCMKKHILNSFSQQHHLIYAEILTRLDVKTLTRFKLVSKDWYNFLSNPINLNRTITGFFYQSSLEYEEKICYVPINTNQDYVSDPKSCLGFLNHPAKLANSCNGLLHWFTSWEQHYVSNPVTNKVVAIPWPVSSSMFYASGVAFDVNEMFFEVVVLMGKQNNILESRIFSSLEMEWSAIKKIKMTRGRVAPYSPTRGVYLNGYMHWELSNNNILLYNVKKRSAKLIESPIRKDLVDRLGITEPGCLGKSKQKLLYCRVLGTSLFVWESTPYCSNSNNIWVGVHIINLSTMMCKNPSLIPHGSQALAFLDYCKWVLLSVKRKIIAYRFEDGVVDEVCEVYKNSRKYIQPSMFFPFVHTLALFNLDAILKKRNAEVSEMEKRASMPSTSHVHEDGQNTPNSGA